MTPRGLGFLADPSEIVSAQLVAYHARSMPRMGTPIASLPASFSWRAHVPSIADQGPTNSCVGQALASSVHLLTIVGGYPIERPSALTIYAFARLETSPRSALFDGGSSPTDAINVMKREGMVPESRWPFDPSKVDEVPPWDVFQHVSDVMVGQHYRVAQGRGAAQLLREAVAQNYFPTFAMDVDDAYLDYDGSDVYRAANGKYVGRHMQTVIGWGDGYLEVLNSWGDAWGDGGVSRIADSFIESRACDSFIIPTTLQMVR